MYDNRLVASPFYANTLAIQTPEEDRTFPKRVGISFTQFSEKSNNWAMNIEDLNDHDDGKSITILD